MRDDLPVHEIVVPDELVEWGKAQAVHQKSRGRLRWLAPWAHEVERLVHRGQEHPLRGHETEALYARLDALVYEAIREGRGDLLVGFDMLSASWLDLVFSFEGEDGSNISFGNRGTYTYPELHELVEHGSDEALAFVARCKELVGDVFPGARIDAIIEEQEPKKCSGCGTTERAVMMALDTESEYCGECWSFLVSPWPHPDEFKPGAKKRRKQRT